VFLTTLPENSALNCQVLLTGSPQVFPMKTAVVIEAGSVFEDELKGTFQH
jgi:hypothetical protein